RPRQSAAGTINPTIEVTWTEAHEVGDRTNLRIAATRVWSRGTLTAQRPASPTVGNRDSAPLRRRDAPVKYHGNNAYTRRWPREQSFSVRSGLARLSPHKRGFARRFRPSSSTCASLRAAWPRHRQGPSSSIGSVQAEKLLLLCSWLPPFQATLERHSMSKFFAGAISKWRFAAILAASDPRSNAGRSHSRQQT